MELSLDEIIKKKKTNTGSGITKKFVTSKGQPRKTLNKPIFKESKHYGDARLRIIQKNRAKITDAREKLLEVPKIRGDARRLIENRRTNNGFAHSMQGALGYRNRVALSTRRALETKPAMFTRRPKLPEAPRGYIDYDNMEQFEEEEYHAARGLSRTVQNDMNLSMDTQMRSEPPAVRRMNSWGSQTSEHFEPFDVYERQERRMSPTELPPPPKGILRATVRQHSPDEYQRRYISDSPSHLSYEMRSRLENAPDPHVSMGIFSNPLRSLSSMPHSPNGYRIVVSNLHPSVTQSDIRELFSDIGDLVDSRIVRPGVAEVIYKSLMDAEKAVDTYHNRQLDRQPMKCLLVNPRASDKPTAPAIKSSSSSSRLAAGKTPLEIDIDALHKVLFRRN